MRGLVLSLPEYFPHCTLTSAMIHTIAAGNGWVVARVCACAGQVNVRASGVWCANGVTILYLI